MRKNKLALILLILALCVCLCAALVACDDGDDTPAPTPDTGNGSTPTISAPTNDGLPKTDYKVTVLYPDRTPVVGVEVQLFDIMDETQAYCGATTGTDGVAILHTSIGLEYFIVIPDLPTGYVYNSEDLIGVDETTKTIIVESETANNRYSISVITEGGMAMQNITVSLKSGDSIIGSKVTDSKGAVNIKVEALGVYDIELAELPKGYSIVTENPKTSADENDYTIEVVSSVIKDETIPENYRYSMDDIMYDFTVMTSDGTKFTLSEVLEEKKCVMINFWYIACAPCRAEFEGIERAYERYIDDSAVLAISTKSEDTMARIATYKAEYSPTLTFDMGQDSINLFANFSTYAQGATPTTIWVDRYGKICDFVKGGGTQTYFMQQFAHYTAEDYVQTVYDPNSGDMPEDTGDTPDVNMPDSSQISSLISPTIQGTYSEVNDGKIWPWLLGTDGSDNILYAGNLKHPNTTSLLTYEFKIDDGQFLTLDYKLNTEDVGNADILSVYIDGGWVCDFDRITDGWKTVYLYTPLSKTVDANDASRTHTLVIQYAKDASDGYLKGDEVVSIKNIRTVTKDELKGDVNILREASWNYNEETARWTSYANVVFNEADGYYHVGSEDGPYLLANIGATTHWLNKSISELSSGGYFTSTNIQAQYYFITAGLSNPPEGCYVEQKKGYAWIALNSDLPNYCIVDEQLAITLDIIVEAFNKTNASFKTSYYDENTWLELCAYFENVKGERVDNILKGICNKEAIVASDKVANHVVVNKTLVPRGVMYKYTPNVTGAYRIYSIIPDEYKGKRSGYVHIIGKNLLKSEDALDNFEQFVTFEAGETYYIGVAFDTPSDWGEIDFYIEYLDTSKDHFSDVSDGTYTYKIDSNGEAIYDEGGDYIYVLNKYNNLQIALGEDNVYHQVLADGSIDTGANSHIWINLANEKHSFLINATLEELAKGTYKIEDLGSKFFDFTSDGGEDYTEYILKLAEQAKQKDSEDDTYGMVQASAELVEILKAALARIDHSSDESWLGFACYYEHLGVYTA